MKEKWEEFKETLTDTETMSKKEFLLTMAVCILGGIVFGMLFSPRKSTVIGSHNGSHNGSDLSKPDKNDDDGKIKIEDDFEDWDDEE